MKHIIPLLFLCLFFVQIGFGQSVPQGMKYQAVARNEKGQVMSNQDIQLRISLYSDPVKREIAYQEIHKIVTSELGLFSLSVGEGINFKGKFEDVPWSSEEIWMEVEVQTDDETDFITISDSKMLSVPYAFFAATAGELAGSSGDRGPIGGSPGGSLWSLLANYQTIPGRDKLGTGDMADLVIVTNDRERMRVLADGDIAVANSMGIEKNLGVKNNVYLNTAAITNSHTASNEPVGETINFGDFTVEGESNTLLTGRLDVDGATNLHNTLEVDGATILNSSLLVEGSTNLNSTLKVLGNTILANDLDVLGPTNMYNTLDVLGKVNFLNPTESTATDIGALVVEGGVGIGKNLHVGGLAAFGGAVTFGDMTNFDDATESTSSTTGAVIIAGGLGVGKNVNVGGVLGVKTNNAGYAAKIENINDSAGDGLVIKLGKTHPGYDGAAYINTPNPGVEFFDDYIGTIRGWIEGDSFAFTDVLGLIPAAYIAGTACNLVETLAGELNDALGLPAGVPALTDATIFDAFNSFADELLLDDWRPDNPTTIIPGFEIEFPTDFCPDFLPSFTMPNINFVDVTNSLHMENEFISFKDKSDRSLGSVRAVSVTEWGDSFFDGAYLVNFICNTVSLDPLDVALSCVREFSNLVDKYNQIGVEYTSGHGDYAEWLERENPSEIISRGDIVAVKGGKITKDLTGAEQVMAVSEHPIVLGNIPEAKDTHKGNNVAFMGQIPVKVMGPVKCGDYIVADATIPGYGIAKAESELTLDNMPFVVGRSWENQPGTGPKMINTVVGVHNGDYFKILKNYEQKLQDAQARMELLSSQSDVRMESLEARVDLLMQQMAQPETKTKIVDETRRK